MNFHGKCRLHCSCWEVNTFEFERIPCSQWNRLDTVRALLGDKQEDVKGHESANTLHLKIHGGWKLIHVTVSGIARYFLKGGAVKVSWRVPILGGMFAFCNFFLMQ